MSLIFTLEIPIPEKTVFILRHGPGRALNITPEQNGRIDV